TRRAFLGGALTIAAAAAAALPKLPSLVSCPIIHGDGIHDDTDALNAFFRGDPVEIEGEVVYLGPGDTACLNGSKHLISDTLYVTNGRRVKISYCDLKATQDFRGDVMLMVTRGGSLDAKRINMHNPRFMGGKTHALGLAA